MSLCLGQGDLQYRGKDLNERYMSAFLTKVAQGKQLVLPGDIGFSCVCEALGNISAVIFFYFVDEIYKSCS